MKCPICGEHEMLTFTDYYRAGCPVQYLIDRRPLCLKEITDEARRLLENPIEGCHNCSGHSMCPRDWYKEYGSPEDGIDDHNSVWGGAGPDCKPVREGVPQLIE